MNLRPQRSDLPNFLSEQLDGIWLGLRVPQVADHLWATEFDELEKRELGDDYPRGNLAEAYAHFNDSSLERAIVELGVAADLVSPAKQRRLLLLLGEESAAPLRAETPTPHFDVTTGRLSLGDQLIAELQVRSNPSNRFAVLAAFQQSDWANVIDNPFDAHAVGTPLRQILRELNLKTKPIRFSAQSSSTRIRWSLRNSEQTVIQVALD